MVKIVNKTKVPVRADEIPVGECFLYNGKCLCASGMIIDMQVCGLLLV